MGKNAEGVFIVLFCGYAGIYRHENPRHNPDAHTDTLNDAALMKGLTDDYGDVIQAGTGVRPKDDRWSMRLCGTVFISTNSDIPINSTVSFNLLL